MGEDDFINATNSPAPQKRRDLLSGYVWTVHGAGIVKDGSAVGQLQDGAAAVADGYHRATQFVRGGSAAGGKQSDTKPTDSSHSQPTPAHPQRPLRQYQQQGRIENPQPPGRNVSNVPMAPSQSIAPVHDLLAGAQACFGDNREKRRQGLIAKHDSSNKNPAINAMKVRKIT